MILDSSSRNGRRILSEDDIKDFGTYYILGDEELLMF